MMPKQFYVFIITLMCCYINHPLKAQITYSAPSSPSQTVARLGTYLEDWTQSRDFSSALKNIESLCNGSRTIKVSDNLMSSIVREDPLLSAASAGELFQLGNYLTGIHKRIRKGYKFSISNISEEHGLLKTGEDKNLSFVKFDINILSPNNKKETCRDIAYVRDNQITGIYRYELGKERNIENLFAKADGCDPIAQYNVAKILLEGESKDTIEAAGYLLEAAAGGNCNPVFPFYYNALKANPEAEWKLAQLFNASNSSLKGYLCSLIGCLYEAQCNLRKADQYYKQGVRLNSEIACVRMGAMYWSMEVSSNIDEINKIQKEIDYTTDVKRGILGMESYCNPEERRNAEVEFLKEKLRNGEDNAICWLEKAIDEGLGAYPVGQFGYCLYDLLLFSYINGIGVNKDCSKALDVVVKYIEDCGYENQFEGLGVNADALKILSCMRNNAEHLFTQYLQMYADINKESNPILHGKSSIEIGKAYYYGLKYVHNGVGFTVPQKYSLAFKYLSEGCELYDDDPEAFLLLSECYKYGRGTAVDNRKAEDLYKKLFNIAQKASQ